MVPTFSSAVSVVRRFHTGFAAALAILTSGPTGLAAAADDCTASNLARTISTVASNTADYLDAHPDVNDAFTNLRGESRPQIRADAQRYLDANPAVRADLQQLRAPLAELGQRCGVAVPPGPAGW